MNETLITHSSTPEFNRTTTPLQGSVVLQIYPPPEKKYKLDLMSDEQNIIFEFIKKGENVIVDACAGSGKSTTILSIATELNTNQFIQLTYNSMLCSEIKNKIDDLNLNHLKVFTYHSLAVKYYSTDAYTDSALRRILRNKTPPRISIPKFNILVIDEAQDMTFLYFKFIIKFCRDMGEPIQLLILGDFMQGLYEFKGADTRFLTHAKELWEKFELLKNPVFHSCTLKMSYRINNQMADFVNHVMLGEKRLYACREGSPVVYLRRSHHNAEIYVVHKILHLIRNGTAKPSDFFILGGSVKGENSAIRRMENTLVEHNIPCHVPMFETDKIDERVIDGKVVFSTFHSVKGRQRKYVFVVGFDKNYFNFFARNMPQNKCPNTLYVACTRASEGLFLIENDSYVDDRPLPFLKMSHYEMKLKPYIEFHGIPQNIFYKKDGDSQQNEHNMMFVNGKKIPVHNITPTDLIKFVSESVLEDITPLLDNIFIKISLENQSCIDIPNIISLKNGFYEDVSDLNGIAIPMMYYENIKNKSLTNEGDGESDGEIHGGNVLKQIIENNMMDVQNKKHGFLRKAIEELPLQCNTISDYLYISNVYVATKEKLYFKLKQIERDEYEWLTKDMIDLCVSRMNNILHPEIFFKGEFTAESEKTIIHHGIDHSKIDRFLLPYFPNELFRFAARVDLVTDFTVWELKCCNSITNDHLIQVVIYAWIWRMVLEDMEKLENVCDFKIFNIKTGEIFRLEATTEQLNTIILKLLKGKYGVKEIKQDNDFIEDCKNYILNEK